MLDVARSLPRHNRVISSSIRATSPSNGCAPAFPVSTSSIWFDRLHTAAQSVEKLRTASANAFHSGESSAASVFPSNPGIPNFSL